MSFIFLIGCSSKKTNTDSELSLIKTNELRIDYIGNLTIIDEDQRHLLLQDIADSDKDRLLIVDKASQSTLKIFDRSGEGPEKFGIVWSACLGVKNNIWVWSRRGLLIILEKEIY